MKGISNALFVVYLLVATVVLILLVLDNYQINPFSDAVFFWLVLPLMMISGVLAKIESYKMILVKLIPVILIWIYLEYEYMICESDCWVGVAVFAATILIGVLAVGSLLATFIYRLIVRRRA